MIILFFSSSNGKKLLAVIQSLMDSNPAKRMEFKEALQLLADNRLIHQTNEKYTMRRGSLDSLTPNMSNNFFKGTKNDTIVPKQKSHLKQRPYIPDSFKN